MLNRKPLAEKIAIVTGAGSGIGKVIAATLAGGGATVVLAGRREALLQENEAAIRAAGGQAAAMPTDIADPAQCATLVRNTVDRFGRLDILVNNATATHMRNAQDIEHLQDVPLEDVQRSLAVNLLAPFVLTREAIPHLRQQERAFIVNMGSIGGARLMYSGGTYGVYVMTKVAARSMMVVFSKELRQYTNIRVHMVDPGMVGTERVVENIAGGATRPDLKESRLVSPQDIADVIFFLVTRTTNGMIDEVSVRREDASYYCYP